MEVVSVSGAGGGTTGALEVTLHFPSRDATLKFKWKEMLPVRPWIDWLPTLPCDSGSATVRKYCHASFPGITSLPALPTSLPGFGGVHEIAPRSFLCYTERWQVFSVAKRSRG